MIITTHGNKFIKLQVGDTTLAIDPSLSSAKASKSGADVSILTSTNEPLDSFDAVTYGNKIPFKIFSPGEYELGSMMIKGIAANPTEGNFVNTHFIIKWDDMSVVVLGDACVKEDMSIEFLEAMETADVLFLSLGSRDTGKIHSAATSLGARIIVPVNFSSLKDPNIVSFAKECGVDKIESVEKLTLKLKDLSGKEGQLVIIN